MFSTFNSPQTRGTAGDYFAQSHEILCLTNALGNLKLESGEIYRCICMYIYIYIYKHNTVFVEENPLQTIKDGGNGSISGGKPPSLEEIRLADIFRVYGRAAWWDW